MAAGNLWRGDGVWEMTLAAKPLERSRTKEGLVFPFLTFSLATKTWNTKKWKTASALFLMHSSLSFLSTKLYLLRIHCVQGP